MGPGSHVGFPISTKNKNLVYDHPMNISAKFDSNLFCGFRKKDENVKFWTLAAMLDFKSAPKTQIW
jgi:hypothetical protein